MDKFLNNIIVLRVIAIVIACVLWFSVNAPAPGSASAQAAAVGKDFPYAVHVELSPNTMVSNLAKSTVVIEVKSSTLDATSLPVDMMNVEVVADARGLGPGQHTVALKALNMPPVQYNILPSSITLTLTSKTTASKPIQVTVTGTPASGYQAGPATTDVSTAQVSGASSAVSRVAAVATKISVDGAKSTVSHTLTLGPVDKNGKPVPGVEVDPVNVTVTVPISPPEVSMQLSPEITGNAAPGYAVSGISVSPDSLAVFGTPKSTSGLTTLQVPVNVNGLRSTHTVTVPISLRSGWTKVKPEKVQVTVHVEPSEIRTFSKIPLHVEQIPTGLKVTAGPPAEVTVRVTGPQSLVANLTTSDVTAYVDASGLTTDSKQAPVDIHVPQWIQVTQVSQDAVPVTVSTAGANQSGGQSGNSAGSNKTGGQSGNSTDANNAMGTNNANAAGNSIG